MYSRAVGFGRSALGSRLWAISFGLYVLKIVFLGINNFLKLTAHSSQLTAHSILALFLLSSNLSNAQCAMCRAALESEEGGLKAEAVNDGIVYLMIIPYVLVAVLFYFIYRLRKKKDT